MALYKVMLVDDEPMSLDFLHSLIDWEKEGFVIVASVTSALQAVSLLFETKPDLVIFDIMMPEMNGAELSSVIHRDYPKMKMLAMSSFDDFDYVRQVLVNGATDYLLKHRVTSEFLVTILAKIKNELSHKEEQNKWLPEYREMIKSFLLEGNQKALEELFSDVLDMSQNLPYTVSQITEVLLKEKAMTAEEDVLLFLYEDLQTFAKRGETEMLKETFSTVLSSWIKTNEKYSPVVTSALSLISSNFRMNLTLEDTSQVIGVNGAYLSRLFHKETGKTFIEALTEQRMNAAKSAIKRGENLKSVASSCGFQSYTYFFKVFKKQMGMTPALYLEEIEKVKKLQ